MPGWRLIILLILSAGVPGVAAAAPSGTVVIAQGVDPTTLDPMNHQETPAGVLARNVFDTLLERDDQLVVRPARAAEMPKLVAPTTWEFKLRSGVRFHNGEPMDAEAVKFSLERLVDSKLKLRGSPPFSPIDRVEIVDAMTVRVHTKAPWPILDTLVSTGQSAILPPSTTGRRTPRSWPATRWAPGRSGSCAGSRTIASSSRRTSSTGAGRRGSPSSSSGPFPTTRCGWPRSRTARSTWR